MSDDSRWEEIKVTGDELVGRVKELIHEGNVRRIIVKDAEGKTYLEIPLTVGVVGAMAAPVVAALGALAALVGGCRIAVEEVETTTEVATAATTEAAQAAGAPEQTEAAAAS